MARKASTQPTDSELAILRVLWERGPSTVREILENHSDPDIGYTTILKFMQIMHGKGLVARDDRNRTHVYRAAQAAEKVQTGMLANLLHRAFGGSARNFLVSALSASKVSKQELKEIRKLLDQMEKRGE
jgi:BlaI family transcriptional regulator, penicillinase repressor